MSPAARARGWLLALVLASGCVTQKQVRVDFSQTPRDYLANEYEGVYQRWTRHDYAQHGVDKSLEVWATFKSWDFREAYISRYAAIYQKSDSERSQLRAGEHEACSQAFEFHVTAQSSNYDWNDLEKASSPWRLTLVDAVGHELPAEKVRVEKLPDAYEREFFPAKGPFTKSYSVRFVPPADGGFSGVRSGSLTLRFSSPVGQINLTWKS